METGVDPAGIATTKCGSDSVGSECPAFIGSEEVIEHMLGMLIVQIKLHFFVTGRNITLFSSGY